ncbi:MAG TPA: FAD-binding oxidoreductase [Myxococcaceae bacterium]|jgi:FAD/FMN-containing dehydrogenase
MSPREQAPRRVEASARDELKKRFRGELLLPGDAGYDELRQVWNARVDRRPALIARCTGVADVMAALGFARERGLPLTVRGGGHDVAGNGVLDDGIVLDMRPMKGIRVDPGRRVVRAQAGLTWGELEHDTEAFGLFPVGGQCSTTGIVGVTLGGGLSSLSRVRGHGVDNLLSVDLVTADGRFVTASETENPELFWGLRGGGGNFGVVTELELRLHPVPDVVSGLLAWPMDRAEEVLRLFRDQCANAPDALLLQLFGWVFPPGMGFPDQLVGQTGIALMPVFHGSVESAATTWLAPWRALKPALDGIGPMPYHTLQHLFDGMLALRLRQYQRCEFLTGLPEEAIEVFARFSREITSPASIVEIASFNGGVAGRVPGDATAAARRDAPLFLVIQSAWSEPGEDERHIAWTRSFWEAMRPFSAGGGHPNFLEGDEPKGRVADYFGRQKHERLRALKRTWDPENVFHRNKNIEP